MLTKKYRTIVPILCLLFYTTASGEKSFVTISNPGEGSTILGTSLLITGRSSQASSKIRLIINTTEIGSAFTDERGNWRFELKDLKDGTYTLVATLITKRFEVLARDQVKFAYRNKHPN